MQTKKRLFVILMIIISVRINAQTPTTCDLFCVTSIKIDSLSGLEVTMFMNGTFDNFINYPFISAVTDLNGDTIAEGKPQFFGQFGSTTQKYNLNTTLTSLPTDFVCTLYLNYSLADLNPYTCELSYPCLSTGMKDVPVFNETKIYPNPINSAAELHIDGILPIGTYFKLVDVTGSVVLQDLISNSSLQLEERKIKKGIYFYEIRDDKRLIKTGKLIIQ